MSLSKMKELLPDQRMCGQEERLSSDFLFHYTTRNAVCGILEKGFRHGLLKESLPNPGRPWQMNFACCFCDLLPHQAKKHRNSYGQFALALTKDWGIAQGISPVSYIHANSPGTSDEYNVLKDLHRSSEEMAEIFALELKHEPQEVKQRGRNFHRVGNYLLFSLLLEQNLVPDGDFMTAMRRDAKVKAAFDNAIDDYVKYVRLGDSASEYLCKCVSALVRRIDGLHSELERRDMFRRMYEDNGRTLYDEREWRSVKQIQAKADFSHRQTAAEAQRNGFLPQEDNLKFQAKDLHQIIVVEEADKEIVLAHVRANECLVTEVEACDRLRTFEEIEND